MAVELHVVESVADAGFHEGGGSIIVLHVKQA